MSYIPSRLNKLREKKGNMYNKSYNCENQTKFTV